MRYMYIYIYRIDYFQKSKMRRMSTIQMSKKKQKIVKERETLRIKLYNVL